MPHQKATGRLEGCWKAVGRLLGLLEIRWKTVGTCRTESKLSGRRDGPFRLTALVLYSDPNTTCSKFRSPCHKNLHIKQLGSPNFPKTRATPFMFHSLSMSAVEPQ